jgi:Tfp pilus assembly PilM family ATPase
MAFGGFDKLKSLGAGGLLNASALPVAIDFGTGSLKALQIAPGDPPSLIAAAVIETPANLLADAAGRLAFQLDALPRLLKAKGFRGRRAVCSIPVSQTLCKPLRLQKTDGVSLTALVRSALPMQLGVDPASVVFRHVEVGDSSKTAGKTEAICFVTSRDLVDRLMRAVRVAKLELVGIHNEFAATAAAFDAPLVGGGAAPVTLYLDIGAGHTNVIITRGGKLGFAKSIELGGRHLDATIARQLKLDAPEAHRHRLAMEHLTAAEARAAAAAPVAAEEPAGMALMSAGMRQQSSGGAAVLTASPARPRATNPSIVPVADLSEALEILTDEVSMCLRYYESMFPGTRAERLVFVGGEARQTALCRQIARTLRLPAQLGDPLARVARTGKEPLNGADLAGCQPGWTVALGLCLSPTDL